MKFRTYVFTTILLFTTLAKGQNSSNSTGSIFPPTLAGHLCGHKLYWHNDRFRADTLDWGSIVSRYLDGTNNIQEKSPEQSLGLAQKTGKRFFRLKKSGALAVALIQSCGYPVFVLSQWSGDAKFTYDTKTSLEKSTIASDYIWEEVDNIKRTLSFTKTSAPSTWIYFRNAGASLYDDHQELLFSRAQITGTMGFDLFDKTRDVKIEENFHRLVLDIIFLADSEKSVKDIEKVLETKMDSLQLDLTYKIPEIVPVGKRK